MELKDKNLYLVGGAVRDELLNRKPSDKDYCYTGNAIYFAEHNNLEIIKENQKLGTVRVLVDGQEIDIASTRVESYPKKGHDPVIESFGCGLKTDLKRRDFTINALAKSTEKDKIYDYYGGRKDIENGVLRVLHENSFSDDPSRIIRGLKFAVRFNFELEEGTKELQKEYLANINYNMNYFRIRKELVDAFSLNKQEILNRFVEQGIYKLLGENVKPPKIKFSVEDIANHYPCRCSWLLYLAGFDLSLIPLNHDEKLILKWAKKLNSQQPTEATPPESILINKLWGNCL